MFVEKTSAETAEVKRHYSGYQDAQYFAAQLFAIFGPQTVSYHSTTIIMESLLYILNAAQFESSAEAKLGA